MLQGYLKISLSILLVLLFTLQRKSPRHEGLLAETRYQGIGLQQPTSTCMLYETWKLAVAILCLDNGINQQVGSFQEQRESLV